MSRKNRAGFSYMEMIIALSLFSMLLMTALPLLNQAGRNMEAAQAGYKAHLSAQSLLLTLRESQPITPQQAAAQAELLGIETYKIFIWNNSAPATITSPNAPQISASLQGLETLPLSQYATVISVLIFNEFDAVSGRAIGIF
jgi:type II secretory pathway pseudopilin PulG